MFKASLVITGGLGVVLMAAAVKATSIPPIQESENWPGGAATQKHLLDLRAFSQRSELLPDAERMNFVLGESIFGKLWVSSPSSTTASDGLGPLFNARSCLSCHVRNGRGVVDPDDPNQVSLLLKLSIPPGTPEQVKQLASESVGFIPEPIYGAQLQTLSVQGLPAEGRLQVSYESRVVEFPDGERVELRAQSYSVEALSYGPMHPDALFSPRIAPAMIGLGLLEAVSDEDILSLEDPDDSNGDGIRGRANRVWDIARGETRIGRFGWKASHPNVSQQNLAAFHEDIGISTWMFPDGFGACTEQQVDCRQMPDGNSEHMDGVEASNEMIRVLETYTRHLAVPARRNAAQQEVIDGRRLFYEAGCHSCHRPSFITSIDAPEGLAAVEIWPYTDLLLHDMGEGLADHRPEFEANGRDWRTPPLWGIGLTQEVSGQTGFLHDGRARNLTEAILWHGGEAEASRQHFMQMDKSQRAQLLMFIESL
ncbi:di-heme oxidoredictase family protein [Nitrincola sp. MINF-07-Sa-05]|uniref:di-heme oxidoreductase family protein n=1 Tax=Nitrincola salilacus TaxID=3400273 RepID=UPI00391842EF